MAYKVEFSPQAEEDLIRLFDFIVERELASHTPDLSIPDRAIQAIIKGVDLLSYSPFSCRKAGTSPFVRELLIPFGRSGYVALFEIHSNQRVIIGAIRHQNEDDYR